MLTSMKPMYELAEEMEFALGAFNVNSFQQVKAAIRIAEIYNSPLVIQGAEAANGFIGGIKDYRNSTLDEKKRGMELLANAVRKYGENSLIPIALHLDHGLSFEVCKAAVDSGYTSIMIDGSSKSFEENIEITREVTEYAHKYGVSVEGELGVLKGVEDNVVSEESTYTHPLDAVKFVKETKVDALAISYGTSHGANKGKNVVLREPIVTAIKECFLHENLHASIVSHGSSNVEEHIVKEINELGGELKNAGGIPIKQLKTAIKAGVRKINVDTDIRLYTTRNLLRLFKNDPDILKDEAINEIYNFMKEKPSAFDPRYYLQNLIPSLTSFDEPTAQMAKVDKAVEDAAMEIIGKLIVEFGSIEKAKYINYRTLEELAKEYK